MVNIKFKASVTLQLNTLINCIYNKCRQDYSKLDLDATGAHQHKTQYQPNESPWTVNALG